MCNALNKLDANYRYFHQLSQERQFQFKKCEAQTYWASVGANKYPQLAVIARRGFSIPQSSAGSERVWSIFDNLQTQNKNRLSASKADKLAFININSILLGNNDLTDYLEGYIEEENKNDAQEALNNEELLYILSLY